SALSAAGRETQSERSAEDERQRKRPAHLPSRPRGLNAACFGKQVGDNCNALVPRRRETRLGMKWECGEEGPRSGLRYRNCPRNCERRDQPQTATGNGKAGDRQRPASQETSPGTNASTPSEGRQGG